MEFLRGELHWEPSNPTNNALIQLVKFHFISKLVIKMDLEMMASTLGSTFRKER